MSWAEIKKAINSNINKSLDVLITEKSNELSTSIGNNNSLLNNSTYGLSALQSIISNVKSLLENTTYGLNAIKNTVNSVNNTVSVVGNIPSVKSVQRGVAFNYRSTYSTTNVSISAVNIDKSVVITNVGGSSAMSTSFSPGPSAPISYGVLNSSTSLTIGTSSNGDYAYPVYWQVIEFY